MSNIDKNFQKNNINANIEIGGDSALNRPYESFLTPTIDPSKVFRNPEDRWGLPGWTYQNEDLMKLEIKLLRRHWQIVCHVNDVPKAGDFMTDNMLGDRILVLRGNDNEVRVFYNVCRHRGSMAVEKPSGNCGRILTCPFHGWTYHLDGTLMGVAQTGAYDTKIDKNKFGMRQIETEIWKGFVFIRFEPGPQPSLAQLMVPYENLFAPYRMEEVKPVAGYSAAQFMLDANWKSARDVDNEGYHVAKVHTCLRDLYGTQYGEDQFSADGVAIARGVFLDTKDRQPQLWTVRNYRKILKQIKTIPEKIKSAWFYVGLFPNVVIQLYPETVSYYMDLPETPSLTKQRYAIYSTPYGDKDSAREIHAASLLARRIDNITYEEDKMLAIWSYEGQRSRAFPGAYLSNFETQVKLYQSIMQKYLPVMTMVDEPKNQNLEELNNQLLARLQNR